MAAKDKAQVPESGNPKAQATAAGKAALETALHTVLSQVKVEDFVWNNPTTIVVKGNQYESDSWRHGPASIELMSISYKHLCKAGGVEKVERVRIALIKGTKYLVITPTTANDPEGIEVSHRPSSVMINAITVLGPAKLTVKSGFRERHTVATTPEGFPIGAGIVIDLSHHLERRSERKKTTDGSTPAAATKAGKSTKSRAKPADSPVTPMSEPEAADM